MTRRLGVVMDPIASIRPYKDSTLAMMLAAQARGWHIAIMELADLSIRDGRARGRMQHVTVHDDVAHWYDAGDTIDGALGELDLILMRKDPPVDLEYIAATYVLERAEADGAVVVNSPRALRDTNEKIATAWFPHCCPAGVLTRSERELRAFLEQQQAIVVKPVWSMAGRSIFFLRAGDPNVNVVLEEMTAHESRFVIAQAFVPDVATTGDKRILLIDGEPVPHALARLPAPGELRANLATGATAQPAELTERDRWICAQIGPTLRERGLVFVGIDVIGGYLTEINVTSPTCIREIDRLSGTDIAGRLIAAIERRHFLNGG